MRRAATGRVQRQLPLAAWQLAWAPEATRMNPASGNSDMHCVATGTRQPRAPGCWQPNGGPWQLAGLRRQRAVVPGNPAQVRGNQALHAGARRRQDRSGAGNEGVGRPQPTDLRRPRCCRATAHGLARQPTNSVVGNGPNWVQATTRASGGNVQSVRQLDHRCQATHLSSLGNANRSRQQVKHAGQLTPESVTSTSPTR